MCSSFWRLYDNFQNNDIKFEELNSEIIRYDKLNKKHYKYDYVDFTLKKSIEFNGDYWHCNPIKYNEDFIHPIMNMRASEIWEKDAKKHKWLEERGYQLLIIWESEYRKYPQETFQKCLDFFNH
jgi:G:T-mismatch repair DNA endonuclease (very short patch repair protein)